MVRYLLRSAPLFLLATAASACRSSSTYVAPYPSPDQEEVSVGYGTTERRDMTGSVASASREEMGAKGQSRVEEMMIGRFPGVDVYSVAGGYQIRIRGNRSIVGNNSPLVVVDGVVLNDGVVALSMLNPGDVGRIDVLKDAASTSVYGSRGANGVIVVTMRRD
jgi:TonB-dependent SusC/RagA subfamily outer membrane receptor